MNTMNASLLMDKVGAVLIGGLVAVFLPVTMVAILVQAL